ncbi:MAG: aminoglycoside phosphotransferase [Acidimicrobiales bacterium]
MVRISPRPVAASVAELLEGATDRQVMNPPESTSGARFEWVTIGGERLVLKFQDARVDCWMRASGDIAGRRFASLWGSGLLDAMPSVIDHAVVGAAVEDNVGAILLRDVSAGLLPSGDIPFGAGQHLRFLDHMATMHARFWGWHDDVGLTPLATRYLMLSPAVAAAEAALGSDAVVPKLMATGWDLLPSVAPRLAEVVLPLLGDPTPLVDALSEVPHTFVHGDWKAANLGSHPDGRTILLDWGEAPGEAAPTADLTWYLALNAARLPESKDQTIASYQAALERQGVDTSPWWERAIGLELLGGMVQFGWEKALGGAGHELAWWEERALHGARWLG